MPQDPSPGLHGSYPTDITDEEGQAGFRLGEVAREGGFEMPFGLTSPSATVRAVIRPCGNGLYAVKAVAPYGRGLMYAILEEEDGLIQPGARANAAYSVAEVLTRYP
jgi:hypothetical protein